VSVVSSTAGSRDAASRGTLVDVVGLILEKGLVIDIYIRVSLVGIELLTVDARIVVASVDTYLRFAEAASRLNLEQAGHKPGLPELIYGVAAARSKAPAELEQVEDAPQPLIDRADERVAADREHQR
jgi:hypothetical protein